jgi:hypothetical protein
MLTSGHHIHPAVYARKMNIAFDAAMKDEELRFRVERFLTDLTRSLRNDGCELIGHIKGLFVADEGGHLMFSVTSHDEPAQFKGELHAGITGGIMTVNIIVYGIELKIVETMFKKAFQRHLKAHYAGSGAKCL